MSRKFFFVANHKRVKMRLCFIETLILIVFVFVSHMNISQAQEDEEKESGVKRFGFVHNIAEDRQIERIGGIYQPEGLDKYMKRKFDAMTAKIDELEKKVDRLNDTVQRSSARGKRQAGALVSTNPAAANR